MDFIKFSPLFLVIYIRVLVGASAIQQKFAAQPSDATVILGHDVVLPCIISNRVGKVQWTKNSIALGYTRHFPMHSNYEVIGDDISGNFSLLIRRATLADQATYECQVLPAATKNRPSGRGLRARARLTISILPEVGPEISVLTAGRQNNTLASYGQLSKYGDNHGEHHYILDAVEGISITLRCWVGGGHPISKILWVHDNVHRTSGNLLGFQQSSVQTDGPPLENGTYPTVYRDFTFSPVSSDNGTRVICHVTHPGYPENAIEPLQLSLNVLAPPGKVVLRMFSLNSGVHQNVDTNVTGTKIVLANESVVLKCEVHKANPKPQVKWFKNGILLDAQTTDPTRSNASAESYWETSITLRPLPKENGASFICSAFNYLSDIPRNSSSLTLNVSYLPDKINMQVMEGRVLIREKVNYVACRISDSNPPAIIRWEIFPSNIKFTEKNSLEFKFHNSSAESKGNLTLKKYQISSIIKLEPIFGKDLKNIKFTCVAQNPLNKQITSYSEVLDIYDSPKKFALNYIKPWSNYSEATFIEGQPIVIECRIKDIHDKTKLIWIKNINGTTFQHQVTQIKNKSYTIIRDSFKVTRFQNQVPIICLGQNALLNINLTKTLTPNITFDPVDIDISPTFIEVNEGKGRTFVCKVGSSNPAPQLVWNIDGGLPFPLNKTIIQNRLYKNPSDNGYLTISTIQLIIAKSYHNRSIKCQAISSITHQSLTAHAKILVFLPPIIDWDFGRELVVQIKEHSEKAVEIVKLAYIGYPPRIDSFQCFHEENSGGILSSSNLSITFEPHKKSFSLNMVSRADNGYHKCRVSNLAGNTWWRFKLIVIFPIKLKPIKTLIVNDMGTEVILACSIVDSSKIDPAPWVIPNQTAWIFHNKSIENNDVFTKFIEGSILKLRIRNAQPHHAGQYACKVDDSFSNASTTINFKVNYGPKILPELNYEDDIKVAGRIGDAIVINCSAKGYPKLNFDWYTGTTDEKRLNMEDGSFTIKENYSATTDFGYSLLTKLKFTPKDIKSTFTCRASNRLGFNTRTYILVEKGPPYPVHIRDLIDVSDNSVEIGWNKTFDGGWPMRYMVGISEVDDGKKRSLTATGLISRRFAPNLSSQSFKNDGNVLVPDSNLPYKWSSVRSDKTDRNFKLTDLKPETLYSICVIAVNRLGNSTCQHSYSRLYLETPRSSYDLNEDNVSAQANSSSEMSYNGMVEFSWLPKDLWSFKALSSYLVIILLAALFVTIILFHVFLIVYYKRNGCSCWSCFVQKNKLSAHSSSSDCSEAHKYDKISKASTNLRDDEGSFKNSQNSNANAKNQCTENMIESIDSKDLISEASHIKYDINEFGREKSTTPIDYAEILRKSATQMNYSINNSSGKNLFDSYKQNQRYQESIYCELKPYERSQNPNLYNSFISNQSLNPSYMLKPPNGLYNGTVKMTPLFLANSRPTSFADWKETELRDGKLQPITVEQFSNQSTDSGNGSIPSPLILNGDQNPLSSPFLALPISQTINDNYKITSKFLNSNSFGNKNQPTAKRLSVVTVTHNYTASKNCLPVVGKDINELYNLESCGTTSSDPSEFSNIDPASMPWIKNYACHEGLSMTHDFRQPFVCEDFEGSIKTTSGIDI